MRSRSLLVVGAFVGLTAACSHPKPVDGDHLDLVIPDAAPPTRVASALEIWGKAKTTPAAPAPSAATAPRRAPSRTPARHHTPHRVRVPQPVREPLPVVATAPAPAPPVAPIPAPAPEPAAPQPTEPQQGHGSGGLGGILRGIGGVIIIRGGQSGMDPCDERGRHGRGGGMIPMPGRGGRNFPGGIVFLSQR